MVIIPMEAYGLPWGGIEVDAGMWRIAYFAAGWPKRIVLEAFL